MESVTDRLSGQIEKCILDLLPNNKRRLFKLLNPKPFQLSFSSALGFDIEIDNQKQIVSVPSRALDFFWSATHVFYSIHQAHLTKQTRSQVNYRVEGCPHYMNALHLYKRRADRLNGGSYSTADRLLGFPIDDPYITEVDELFLLGFEWFAYQFLCGTSFVSDTNSKDESNHTSAISSISASQLITKPRTNVSPSALGIAIFTTSLASSSRTVLIEKHWSKEHSRAFQRAIDLLSVHFSNGYNDVYRFASHILHAHTGTQRPIPKDTLNWRQFYFNYIAQLDAPNKHLGT